MKMKKLLITAVLVFMVSMMLVFNTVQADTRPLINAVNEAVRAGVITHIEGDGGYYVNEIGWALLNAQQKENFTYALALHYKATGGEHIRCVIFGSHSAKVLAKYGVFGFKIY